MAWINPGWAQHWALLLYCIKCFGSNTTPSSPSDHSTMAQVLVDNQTAMGWRHFLQGKLIKDWVDVFNKERWDEGKKDDDRIVVKVITAITSFNLNLWRSRCSQVFGGTNIHRLRKMRERLISQVKDLGFEYSTSNSKWHWGARPVWAHSIKRYYFTQSGASYPTL